MHVHAAVRERCLLDRAEAEMSSTFRPTRMVSGKAGGPAPTATQQALSACAGSLATSVIVTPLEVVKVRQQAAAHAPALRTQLTTAD